jgi:hypothetical protein
VVGRSKGEVGARLAPSIISFGEEGIGGRQRDCVIICSLGGSTGEAKYRWGWFGEQAEEESVRNRAESTVRVNGEGEKDCIGVVEHSDDEFTIGIVPGRIGPLNFQHSASW